MFTLHFAPDVHTHHIAMGYKSHLECCRSLRCSRCCSPSSPPPRRRWPPITVLPAENGVLASSDRRVAPGGSLPSPTNATCCPSRRTCHQTCSNNVQGTCAQTSAVRHPKQPRGRTWAPAACAGSGETDEPRVAGSAESTGWVCPG